MTHYKVERLGLHGDGVVHGPLFAPMTLPGEVITGTPVGQRLTEVRIVEPSEERIAAPCRHFRSCGGCQLQHASDAFVADWKSDVIRTALDARGLETELRPIVTSPPASRRRATFGARRTKKGAMAGFHAQGTDTLIEIPGCLILEPDVMKGLEIARHLAVAGGSRKSNLAVTVTSSANGLDVAASGGKPLNAALIEQLASYCAGAGIARLTWEGETIATLAPPYQSFGAAHVVPPPGAFLQATRHGEAALLSAVREVVGPARQVADLFAGCGTFALPLSKQAEVFAVEGEADMLEALEGGWRRARGLRPITTQTRDLFRRPLLPDELSRFDAVVLDPPRAGAEAQIAQLAKAMPAQIAYVSCNPVTFARDAATLLAAEYTLDWVQPVDQFRWSSHIELAASFSTSVKSQRPR